MITVTDAEGENRRILVQPSVNETIVNVNRRYRGTWDIYPNWYPMTIREDGEIVAIIPLKENENA